MKKLLILFLFTLPMVLSAHVYDDLIGQEESNLNTEIFLCKNHICTVSEFRYFNNDLLDDTIETVETYSDHNGVIYKVLLYIPETVKLKNRDIIEAIFDAIKHHTGHSKELVYLKEHQSDKYGNRTVISLIDAKRQAAYKSHLESAYLQAFKSYKTRLSPTVK